MKNPQLAAALAAAGSPMTVPDFKKLVEDVFCELYPDATTEVVLTRPIALGAAFVAMVRHRMGAYKLAEEAIMETLVNVRKRGSKKLRRTDRAV